MPQIVEFNGKNIEFPDGMGAAEIEGLIKQNMLQLPPAETPAKPANRGLGKELVRSLGLTARAGIEGLADTANVFTEPVAGLQRLAGVPTKSTGQIGAELANFFGLPTAETSTERVVQQGAKLMAGGGGLAGAAGLAAKAPGMAGQAAQFLAANPVQQVGSAAGAGLLGGTVKEMGGNDLAQAGAAMGGGLLGAFTPQAIQGAGRLVKNAVTPAMPAAQIDVKLAEILQKTGVDFAGLEGNVQRGLRAELTKAFQAGKELNPEAVRRLADFKAVGVTPTRGMVSQNPAQITREMNLAKIGANSDNGNLQGLALLQNNNNSKIIDSLNANGAARNIEPIAAGRVITDKITGTQSALRNAESEAWKNAKASPGYTQPIFADGLSAANKALGDEALMPFMPKQISDYMGAFQTGQQPFTPQAYKNLQSMLSNTMRQGGNEAAAAGVARRALDSVPMQTMPNTGQSLDAINKARGATAAAYKYEDSSPLVRSVLSDTRNADPEKIAQSFVINGTVNDARTIAKEVGADGAATIREALAAHIKNKALSGAADETGKVSQAALKSVLDKIGDEKLGLFFSKDEVKNLRATGRVATYMQNQPAGSAVNNSNSGALILGRGGDFLEALAKKVPFGAQAVADPLRNLNISLSQRQAQKIMPGLLLEQQKRGLLQPLLLPGIAAGSGLLSQ